MEELERLTQDVNDFNRLICFLGRRDLDTLNSEALFRKRGVCQVDLLILMGGITTPDFVELAAKAYHNGIAKRLMIAGGVGHSTQNLRNNVAAHPVYGAIPTAERAEADIICDIMVSFLGIDRSEILIEHNSTNCGNNASFALEVVRQSGTLPETALIIQDPIMMRRTYESFLQEWRNEPTSFDAFAPVIPTLRVQSGAIGFADVSHGGYYRMNAFIDLVMGEIPRLHDDENGYGPKGHGFIGHVEIPEDVLCAFYRLLPRYANHVRPEYQSQRDLMP